MSNSSVLFQLPHITMGTPAAVNLWTKNIAEAFARAGISPTIQYMGARSFRTRDLNGVKYISLPFFQAWMAGIPKLRNIAVTTIQKRFIKKYGRNYNLISPLGGPYHLASETSKVNAVKQVGSQYLHPILEHPKIRTGLSDDGMFSDYMSAVADLYDIIMPISTHIQGLFISYGRQKPTLLNPIIVNVDGKAANNNMSSVGPTTLLYCGNLEHEEEMMLLFRVFYFVSNHLPLTRLEVIGGGGTKTRTLALLSKYKHVCANLNIENFVNFTGRIPHMEVLSRYKNAHAFLLPRPFRDYSLAGFPSKLGEYLATSKPVICTGTGDIPSYLKDGVSAYLVMKEDPEIFAQAVIRALQDPKAGSIGSRGFDVAKKSFSIEATAERLRRFFGDLNVL